MNLTTRLGLKKPELTDVADIDDLNFNADIIDGAVGVSVVTNRAAADLAGTFDGEIIYDDEVDQLFMQRAGSWHQLIMVDALGRYVANPFESSQVGFVIGPVDDSNLAMSDTDIQSWSDALGGLPGTLTLNKTGGDILIGTNPGSNPVPVIKIGTAPDQIQLSSKGIDAPGMDQLQSSRTANVTPSTSWDKTPGGALECSVLNIPAPPSGKFLVSIAARASDVPGAPDSIQATYRVERHSTGNQLGSMGEEYNTIIFQGKSQSSITDVIKGAVPDVGYDFFVMVKKTGGSPAEFAFRKILVIPQM